jgi:serine/threonine protein kinase
VREADVKNWISFVDIVHGDIKPSNILVAEDAEADSLSVALADFGFSRFAENSQDGLNSLVHLARSEPWDAPEWTHALTRLRDAKKMDVYSFGMLCLWLFFADQKPNDEWGSDATLHDAFTARNRDAFEELQYRKRTGNDVLKLAYTLVERHETYTADTKDRLKKVFALSLEDDPDKRTSGMDELIKVFGQNDEDDDNGPG